MNIFPLPGVAVLVFILLIIILLIYVVFSKRKKRALLITFGTISTYILWVLYNCTPSLKDIEAIKPMAKSIESYIVKHGMPRKLEDISTLPYKLYKNSNPSFYYFKVGDDKYEIFKNGHVEITSMAKRGNGYTRLWIFFNKADNGKYSLEKEEYFLVHRSGICSSMRQ